MDRSVMDIGMEMGQVKVVVLVTARRNATDYETQAIAVWERFMRQHAAVRCFFVEASEDVAEVVEEGSWLVTPGYEGLCPGMLIKLVHAYRHILEKFPEVNYIVKTNVSSIWHWERLIERLFSLPVVGLAWGVTFDYNYPSGCGTVYSRDVICDFIRLLEEGVVSEEMLYTWNDDQVTGWLLTYVMNVLVWDGATRLHYSRIGTDKEQLERLQDKAYYHVRCKYEAEEEGRLKYEIPFMNYVVDLWYGKDT